MFTKGVITGVLATAIVTIVSACTTRIVIPYVRQRLGKNPNISGRWSLFYSHSEESPPVGEVHITQHFNRIKARAHTTISRHGKKQHMNYTISGLFSSGRATFIYDNIDLQGYVTGAGVLKLSHNGKMFIGLVTYISHSSQKVETHEYALRRP
jgi:hypothetical protein